METDKKIIPYFNIYASDFKVFKDTLNADEIIEVLNEISNICLFGKSNFESKNDIQMMFFQKLKDNLLKNIPRYNASVGNGQKGGRPKKTQEKPTGFKNNNPGETHSETIEYNRIEYNKIEKIIDPYINPIKNYFMDEYEKVFGSKPYLMKDDCFKITELEKDIEDFKECIPIAIKKLSEINFADINFKPSANWLLKENNFAKVMNGEFDKQERNQQNDSEYNPYL